MSAIADKQAWEEYREQELRGVTPILASHGYALDETQVHIRGERYLMAGPRDVGGGGYKLVLTGTHTRDNKRVIIKVSSAPGGMREIEREREMSALLHKIDFALYSFHSPQELLFIKEGPYRIHVTEYITEDRPLFERSLQEQFFLALQALEAQEGVHATTSAHADLIRDTFGMLTAPEYLSSYEIFAKEARKNDPESQDLREALAAGGAFLKENKTIIERYCGFLTHADFVPNNLRILGNRLYLLDYASLHFGNKYESWARFINFMNHHHLALENMLLTYVRENRGEEEYLCLRLMRVYKLGFLLKYHTETLNRATGNLHELSRERITFWTESLRAVLEDRTVSPAALSHYLERLDVLRSPEEIARQHAMLGKHTRV